MVKLAIPTQSLLQLLVLLGKYNGRSRTIAILHTTYRLTMRLVSAHISQWDVKFAGKWDSVLKGNSALRAHVVRRRYEPMLGKGLMNVQNPLVWPVCYFSREACAARDIHATWMRHPGRWRQCRIKSLESLRPVGQYDPQSDRKTSHPRTCVVCCQENCYLHSRWRHPQQEGDGRLEPKLA